MAETRKQLKARLQAAGVWDDYVEIRCRLAQEGMTAPEARAEALRRVEALAQDEADGADGEEEPDAEPLERPLTEYADYRRYLTDHFRVLGIEPDGESVDIALPDPLLKPDRAREWPENDRLAALPDAQQRGQALKASIDATLAQCFALLRRIHPVELDAPQASLFPGNDSRCDNAPDDMLLLATLEDVAALLAWHQPADALASLEHEAEYARQSLADLHKRARDLLPDASVQPAVGG